MYLWVSVPKIPHSSHKYYAETQARYVKITTTQSHVGSASSIELRYLKSTSLARPVTSASGKQLFGSSQSHYKHGKLGSDTIIVTCKSLAYH